ncbi:MAG: hypothetical protein Satyrvirus1_13 [Satyrvirus sp.]|uniref:Glycosyl hydrolase family 32 N-terminal domain-containing protein n=1 Tax=Satyrvirus sp. TaxID=2487771 RepID=A0A3G5ACQ4_9VIRU|nr:MAG: hypothetical protein Satyrvirus1_13 [Satyrvirus sp.]
MKFIVPYELLSINNPDVRETYEKSYEKFYLKYSDSSLAEVDCVSNCTHQLLLNTEKKYLLIFCDDDVEIKAIDDVLFRNYVGKNNIWYAEFQKNWNFVELNKRISQCTLCNDYYIDECKLCLDCKNIKNRIKNIDISKKYLLIPISNSTDENQIKIYADKILVHEFDVCLANDNLDWWAYLDLSCYIHRNISIVLRDENKSLNQIHISDDIPISDESLRPQLHYTPKCGWTNDPNGLVYFQDEYHLFYQHNPFSREWGNMYWGHAVSSDLLHWKELPLALHPNTMASGMCFSGSANYDENQLFIIFTDTNVGERLAISNDNGIIWKIVGKNIIPKHPGRDPKIIKYQNGWILIIYTIHDNKDCFAFYKSLNLDSWELTGYLAGYRECPEMVELEIDKNPENKKWIIFGFDAEYQIGTFDGKIFIPQVCENHTLGEKYRLHHGQFQAAQCFSRATRNIQIGWVPIEMGNMFNQTFSLPLELSLRTTEIGVRLFAEPIKEIEQLRTSCQSLNDCYSDNATIAVCGQLFDILIDVEINSSELVVLKFGDNEICYNNALNELNGIQLPMKNNNLKFRIIIDRPMYEICINSGIVYCTHKRNDMGKNIESIQLVGAPIYINNFTVYQLKSIYD